MGASIAVEFRRRWPGMYDTYRMECRSGRLQPGGIFVWQAGDQLIVNLATQRGVGRGSARLEWVRQAARETAQLPFAGLALPRIGAGLGGLDWTDVRAVLQDELLSLAAQPSFRRTRRITGPQAGRQRPMPGSGSHQEDTAYAVR